MSCLTDTEYIYFYVPKFQIGKGIHQGCMLSLCLFNLHAEYIMRNAGLDEALTGTKIAGRNINNLKYADDTTLMIESEEELKSLFFFYFYFFNLWWILSYIEMKQPWVYMCSPSQSPFPPPSPPVPSRFSQCTRSQRLSHASNLGWWSVSP